MSESNQSPLRVVALQVENVKRIQAVGIRPWLVDPAVVDRIVAERCPRRQQAAE